jgi:hypothetical protein
MNNRCFICFLFLCFFDISCNLRVDDGIWVQVDGIDNPKCGAVTFPCKTIQFALDKIERENFTKNIVILKPGEYNGTGNVDLSVKCPRYCNHQYSQKIVIMGATGNYRDVIINGNSVDRILSDGNAIELVLDSITFSNGKTQNDGGCISLSNSFIRKLTISNSFFWNCSAIGYGGAIFANNVAELSIEHSIFIHNRAQEGGGTIASRSSTKITVHMCDFMDSSCDGNGGAILADGEADIRNSTFFANAARECGGALYIANHRGLILYSEFLENTAKNGGAIYLNPPTMSIFQGVRVAKNYAEQNGGGLFVTGSPRDPSVLFVHTSDFIRNEASHFGGGAFIQNIDNSLQGGANIFHCNFQENYSFLGGGLYLNNSAVSLLGSFFRHNHSPNNRTAIDDRNLFCDRQSKEIYHSCLVCCGARTCTQCQAIGACLDESNGISHTMQCFTSGTIGMCPEVWTNCEPVPARSPQTPSPDAPVKSPSHTPAISPAVSPAFSGNSSNNSTHLPIDRMPGVLIGLIAIVAVIAIVVVGIVAYLLWRRKRETEFELI